MRAPAYIVFEGIDGSGTTTQSKKLVKFLQDEGVKAIWTCEPTKGPIGRLVRDFFEGCYGELPKWRTMFHLFQADREQHYEHIIKWLAEGYVVVADRSWISSLAYQAVEKEDKEEATRLITRCNEHSHVEDVTFVLRCGAEIALRRTKGGGEEKSDLYETLDNLKKVAMFYNNLSRTEPPLRHIDSSVDTKEVVFGKILKELNIVGLRRSS